MKGGEGGEGKGGGKNPLSSQFLVCLVDAHQLNSPVRWPDPAVSREREGEREGGEQGRKKRKEEKKRG